jgi:hypothetical protein
LGSEQSKLGISGNLAETMYRTVFADINVKNDRALQTLFSCLFRIVRFDPVEQMFLRNILADAPPEFPDLSILIWPVFSSLLGTSDQRNLKLNETKM